MKNVILVGWIRTGLPADCGETMKNQLLIKRMEEFFWGGHFEILGINKSHIFKDDILKIKEPIDWNRVDNNLEELRLDSLKFLKTTLK